LHTVAFIILLTIVAVLAYRVTSAEERERYLAVAVDFLKRLRAAAAEPRPELDRFRDALRARTPRLLATPAIVLISTLVFGGMLFGATAINDPQTLLAWGASLGIRTSNGEWWRLATSTFVHTGMLHLLIDTAVLIQLGATLERLVGRVTFTAVYLSAGAFAGLINLSAYPVNVTVGSSATIFGLYGLLLASVVWQTFRGWRERHEPDVEIEEQDAAQRVTIPLIALKRLGAAAAVFLVYSMFSGHAHAAEFTGLLVGLMCGAVLARRAGEDIPGTRDVAYTVLATFVIAAIGAIGLRNIADVKPEIARVLATETRTAAAYQTGMDAFKKGRITAQALAQLAEGTIVPELQAEDWRLKALRNVPPEHQPIVADAREYLRLRCASWRARGEAIRRTYADPPRRPDRVENDEWRFRVQARFRADIAARGNAEGAERASMEAFQRITTSF
jgi:membrane associated rhomboid family serine protease